MVFLPRCDEIRRRVSQGIVDYATWDGDPELLELLKPIFTKKRLVIWSLDPHPGPIDDIRSIIEPLGVEFIEHIIQERNRCHRMCVCSLSNSINLPHISISETYRPNQKVFDRIYNNDRAAADIARTDGFLVACTIPFIELYMRYNRSIIVVAAIRYPYAIDFDPQRWLWLNDRLRALMSNRHNIIGANSHYDSEFMHYFLGVRPDYIPGFAGYTGEHYQPIRKSFIYSRRPYKVESFWNKQFEDHYKFTKASFKIKQFHTVYRAGYEFADIAKHLGIVHQPYQVSTISFYEQYSMGIPLFAPSLNFLTNLHLQHFLVREKSHQKPQRRSGITEHSGYNGSARVPLFPTSSSFVTLDPNDDFDARSVRYWLSLSDFFTFPHIVHFDSIEHLVEILQVMWNEPSNLKEIHEAMRIENRLRIKSLLRYWRQRLLDIAHLSPHRPE